MRQDSETNIIVLNTALKYKIQRNTHTQKHKFTKYKHTLKRATAEAREIKRSIAPRERLQKCCDLENRVRVRQGHWKCHHLIESTPHTISYWRSIITMALVYLGSFLRYSMSKNVVTLKSGSKDIQGHWEWYHSIDCVWCVFFLLVFFSKFGPKMHRFWDIRQKCRDLENRVRGPSRSLEISPVDRAHTTSYWRSIVTE